MRRNLIAAVVLALLCAGYAFAASFIITKTGETDTSITFSYPAQTGADGYRYYAPGAVSGDTCTGTRVSRTFDPSRTSVRFGKVESGTYCVEAVVITPIGSGQYPTELPPPPPPPPSEWTFCANEGATCSFTGTKEVRYGAATTYFTRIATASIGCTNAVFGDPIVGTAKHCDYRTLPPPACSNGTDDDGDGKTDFPADPGCASATDTDETDPAPPGTDMLGWQLTPQNIGLAPHGLSCANLPAYTTNPIPAGTTITERRITWTSGTLNLNAGGIKIIRSCMQPQANASTTFAVVESFTPPQPNTIIDSELDGHLVGQQAMSKACGLRGIWSEITRTYVHDVGSGICLVDYNSSLNYNVIFKNNWIGRLVGYGDPGGSGSHNEAATTRCARIDTNPARQMVWRGNWIQTDTPGNSSGGLFIQTTWGCPIGNLYVQNNLLDGGPNWDMYADGGSYSGRFEATNNRFVPGGYGACNVTGFNWNVWSNNYVYSSSSPDAKGAQVGGC